MRLLICLIWTLTLCCAGRAQKSVEHMYPSDEEINLMVTQADRAMENYKQVVEQEEELFAGSSDIALDKKVLNLWAYAKEVLRAKPQGFNSIAGFDVVTNLDDASRNASVIAGNSALEVLKALSSGKVSAKTDSFVTLFQSASAASTLLYTVSENAAALYTRFLSWQKDTSGKAVQMLQQCDDALKSSAKRQQP